MRRLYSAFALVVLVLFSSAASLSWRKITIQDTCSVFLPSSWSVVEGDASVMEDAYGPGVSCRTLLTAENGNTASMTVLMYWPYSSDRPDKFVSDMAEALKSRYNSLFRPVPSQIQAGTIRASIMTYGIGRNNSQKVTAFVNGGKIYCLIMTYRSSLEREMSSLTRHIISHWEF